jgi:hypothetical protein
MSDEIKKNRKVISRDALPVRPPMILTIVAMLSLNAGNASPFLYGAVITLLVILWIGFFVSFSKEDRIDPFADPEPDKEKNIFQQKIDELKKS